MKKISRREFLTVVAAASAAGLLSACGGSSGGTTSTSAAGGGAASGQSINLRIASSSPTVEFEGDGTTALGISALYFVNQISARTDGRITAQIFPDGQIASSTQEYIGGLQNGAFDIGILNCGSWGDYTSAFAGLNMPYLYLNYDEAYAVLDSEVGQSWLQKAQEDTTTIPLAFFDIGFRELTCNNEVHTPDDLKGVKIRVMPDPIQTATWEALGCAVTPVAYSGAVHRSAAGHGGRTGEPPVQHRLLQGLRAAELHGHDQPQLHRHHPGHQPRHLEPAFRR